MAIKAKDQITIVDLTDVQSVTIYYLLQTSTLSAPSQPVTLNPDGWSTIEPAFTDGTTNTLYTCVKTLFKNGDFSWGDVSVSSSYEAAKSAYNQAIATNQKLTNWCDTNDMTLINGAMVATGTLEAQAIVGGSITSDQLASNSVTTDKLIANTVTADKIDINDLFAQDITASGTISGLKLRGEDISIGDSYTSGNVYSEGEFVGKVFDDGSQKYYMFDLTTQSHYVDSSIECSLSSITMDGYGGVSFMSRGSNGYITMEAPDISISATNPIELNAPIVSSTCTSFSGGVVSSGSVVVVKKLGWCQVFGEFTLTGTVSDWTEILAAAKVPAPQHGTNIYPAAMQWGSSFLRLPRIQVNGGGGLRVRYGAAGTYDFSVAYPIE
ncbi:MAG: hypothetical protein WCS15_11595 [Prevotella sp.]